MKRDLDFQEEEIDEKLRRSEASQEQLKAMILDLRKDLDSCRSETWRLQQCTELNGYKAMLLSQMDPSTDAEHDEKFSDADLEELNENADAELALLMEKLGSVRSEMQELDEKRRVLAKELEEFEDCDFSDSEDEGDDLRSLRFGNLVQRA